MAFAKSAAAALLIAALAACASAANVKKCEWASEYSLCVATPAAVFPESHKSPNRLAEKDVEVWARETLCMAQDSKEKCAAAATPKNKVTSDPCAWDDDQKICRADIPYTTDVACPGDLAELTNKCGQYTEGGACGKDNLCKWEFVNGRNLCIPKRVGELGIKTVAAYFIHYYYNPNTFGTCEASKGYREFLNKCWSQGKDQCAKSWPTCKWWPNEGVCTTTQTADAAYLTGGDGRSVGAEAECMKHGDKGSCVGAGTVGIDESKARKYLEDNAPIPGLTSFN